jgi:hypothetical protein
MEKVKLLASFLAICVETSIVKPEPKPSSRNKLPPEAEITTKPIEEILQF